MGVMLISANSMSQSLPSFQMLLTTGKSFSSQHLSNIKPLILIYFAPDCEHCQVLMDAIFKKINEFKNSQIAMITFKPLNEVEDFQNHYKTIRHQNILVGTGVRLFFLENIIN